MPNIEAKSESDHRADADFFVVSEVILPDLICPECGCQWGSPLREEGNICGDALWNLGRPDETCNGILIAIQENKP